MVRKAFILLVEDNEDDIELTLRALKQQNIANRVEVVRDGAEALDFFLARGSHADRDEADLPDLVLLDINMPRLNGFEVLEALREHEATRLLPVVMLTTSREDRDVLRSYAGRANSYVRKPIDFREFVEAVRSLGLYWLVLNEPPQR